MVRNSTGVLGTDGILLLSQKSLLYHIFFNACETLLSNGSRVFKNYSKKVIFDGVIKYHRYVPPLYVEILDCFRVGLVPICTYNIPHEVKGKVAPSVVFVRKQNSSSDLFYLHLGFLPITAIMSNSNEVASKPPKRSCQ